MKLIERRNNLVIINNTALIHSREDVNEIRYERRLISCNKNKHSAVRI